MKLSALQRFILKKLFLSGKTRASRQGLVDFYKGQKSTPPPIRQVKIVTQSLERLIEKGLIVGFGKKTQEKLFIESLQLTGLGRRTARQLLGRQTALPFPKKRK